MPDPNDMLRQIQMVCEDIAKSRTALGYNSDLMTRLGMVVFGNIEVVRDAIQAPDGQSWRAGMFAESERRGNLHAALTQTHEYAEIALAGTPRRPPYRSIFTEIRRISAEAMDGNGQQRGDKT